MRFALQLSFLNWTLGFYFSYTTKFFRSWGKNLGRTGRFQRWKVVQSNEKLWTPNSSSEYRGVSGWLLVFFTSQETFSSHQYDKLQLQLWENPEIWGCPTTENFLEWKIEQPCLSIHQTAIKATSNKHFHFNCSLWTQNTRILRAGIWAPSLPPLLKPQHDHSHHFYLVLWLRNSSTEVDPYSRAGSKRWSRPRGDAGGKNWTSAASHIIFISQLFHNETERCLLSRIYSASFASGMGIWLSKTDRRVDRLYIPMRQGPSFLTMLILKLLWQS